MSALNQAVASYNGSAIPVCVYTTFDPANESATGITLSGGNLVATVNGAGVQVRATNPVLVGTKHYWEVTIGTSAGVNNMTFGIDNGVPFPPTNYVGATADSYGFIVTGNYFNNGSTHTSGSAYAVGDVVGFALDLVGNTIQLYKNGAANGAPVTVTHQNYYPAVGTRGTGNQIMTANFGQTSFVYPVPTGFTGGITCPYTTYARWNPAAKGTHIILSGANLIETGDNTGQGEVRATIAVLTGTKRYWEVQALATTIDQVIGVDNGSGNLNGFTGSDGNAYGYYGGGGVFHSGTTSGTQASYTTSDVIGIALDLVGNTIQFYKNNVSTGSAVSIPIGSYYPAAGTGLRNMSGGARFDPASMTYSPPAGFTAGVF